MKKRIFLTGATGIMGMQGLLRLMEYPERYEITVLARPTSKNHKKLVFFEAKGGRVIWGDLLDKDSVRKGVEGADIVLHVGGMVSPEADWHPERTVSVNVGGMKNIIEAALPRKEEVRIVYIGSVSQYGPKYVPDHWGAVGDPLVPASFDAYAYSKTAAERLLMESDIKWWVSLRQTGILHSGLLMKATDPITFHVPILGVLEWVSAEDSGRLLERVCRDEVPDTFWRRAYNIGGGAPYRLTNYEFEKSILKGMGCPAPEKIFDTGWFATKNFHGFWFSDSDELDEILHFRSGTSYEEYLASMKRELPWYFRLAPLAPAFALKAFMKRVALTPQLGSLWWLKTDDTERIRAAWGSREEHDAIPSWKDTDIARPSDTVPPRKKKPEMTEEEEERRLTLRCPECGAEYSLKAITRVAGHGCPVCLRRSTHLDNIDSIMQKLT